MTPGLPRTAPFNGPVGWLAAQAIVFGAWAAILGVVANAMFLDAFGSRSLPFTYIAIGIAGIAVSAGIRRASERFDLLRLAVGVLGAASVVFTVAWLVARRDDGAWVSAPLLVIFPILIQLGFVFIGGQAGRVLDIGGIKASFPRIMAGFPAGATIGGLAAVPLVDAFGRVEDLLLVTALVQGAFAALVWATGRRFARELAPRPTLAAEASIDVNDDRAPMSLRRLLGRSFVVLILLYQVLSALGSQIADFLVFDRASALFPGAEDLGRFVAGYTALMNAAAIGFLFLAAGPLLRRHGLRLGIGANPVADFALALAIGFAVVVAGPASAVVLGVVSAARIVDIVLTDGMTRTSINALYQVLPARQRLATQATVEGMGVPIAIGASGVLILVLDALPGALVLRVVVLAVACAAWMWVAARLYREYAPALAAALQTGRLLDVDAPIEASLEDLVALTTLAAGSDKRAARLAVDLAALIPATATPRDAVAHGARSGTPDMQAVAGWDARSVTLGDTRSTPVRDTRALDLLLHDPEPDVLAAALRAVEPGDDFAVEPAMAGLLDSRTAAAASAAIGRLGDGALGALRDVLDSARLGAVPGRARGTGSNVLALRMVRAVRTASPDRDGVLVANLDHPDREIGLAVMERLAGSTRAIAGAATVLDRQRGQDLEHAGRVLTALVAVTAAPDTDPDGVVAHALEDELDLLRRRIAARLEARFGRDELAPVLERVRRDAGQSALAIEALEVAVGRDTAADIVALLAPGLDPQQRLNQLVGRSERLDSTSARAWLVEIARDRDATWRSPWLRACAIRASRLLGLQNPEGSGLERSGHEPDVGSLDPTVAEELALARSA